MKLNTEQIKEIIPHRYPFLFVDSIEELEPGKRAVGKKNVIANEWIFQGHFPDYAIFPGSLTLEACAQTAAIILLSLDEHKGALASLVGVDMLRFKQRVRPGDTLTIEVEFRKIRGGIGKGKVIVTVDGGVAMEAEIMLAMQER